MKRDVRVSILIAINFLVLQMGKFDFEGGGGSQMGSKICMNTSCATATTHEWKKGWRLGSGGYADLCFRCG